MRRELTKQCLHRHPLNPIEQETVPSRSYELAHGHSFAITPGGAGDDDRHHNHHHGQHHYLQSHNPNPSPTSLGLDWQFTNNEEMDRFFDNMAANTPNGPGRSGSAGTRFSPIKRKSVDLGPGSAGSDNREHDEDEDNGCQVLLF